MDPNRYACTVLEETRAALERLNWVTLAYCKRHLATLLEEVQTIVNRMESALMDKHEYEMARDRLRDARTELDDLKAEKNEIESEIEDLKTEVEDLERMRGSASPLDPIGMYKN